MEELKLLLKLITDLPTMALWVLAGYLVWQLSILASIYGTIRFVVQKIYEGIVHIVTVKREIKERETKRLDPMILLGPIAITHDNVVNSLLAQLDRVRGKNTGTNSRYIHQCSVDWLREAINDKEAKDREANK